MSIFKASTPAILPETCRLTSGVKGYVAHVLNRSQAATVVARATGMGYRAAYREVKASQFVVGGTLFVRDSLPGHKGWFAID